MPISKLLFVPRTKKVVQILFYGHCATLLRLFPINPNLPAQMFLQELPQPRQQVIILVNIQLPAG